MTNNKNNIILIRVITILALMCILLILIIAVYRYINPAGTDSRSMITDAQMQADDNENIVNSTQTAVITPSPAPTASPTPTAIPNEPYVIAWISDTQGYTAFCPEIFDTVTNWLVENHEEENIQYVLHTGDLVDSCDDAQQWNNAVNAMYVLDGHLPVYTIAGNHDIKSGEHEYENYLKYFGEDKYADIVSVGGWYKNGRGRYDLLEINGRDIILISIGYSVVSADLEWVNNVLDEYSDYTAILCVHGYIDTDDTYSSDGKRLLPGVVEVSENIEVVLCGHRHGIHHNAVSFDDDGDGIDDREVYQVLFNGQTTRNYGGGYICLLTFNEDASEIDVSYYSPYYDDSEGSDAMERFTIPLD